MTEDYTRALAIGRAKVKSAGLDADLMGEAINAYALAVERAYLLRDAWDREGKPATTTGSRGQPRPHPLVAMIEDAERHVIACDSALTRRRAERRGNVSGSSLGQPRAPDRRVVPLRTAS